MRAEEGATLPVTQQALRSCPWTDQSLLLQKPRYAFCAAIWGSGIGFSVGALVLGESLRRASAAGYDRILLHTADVPQCLLNLLGKVWVLKLVEYIDADESLFMSKGKSHDRFDGCFTKLHVLSLTEYDKVLMLDLDLAIMGCPDELFELPAPAALFRGSGCMPHGVKIDGRRFFMGDDAEPPWQWTGGGGINAGVMLFEPNMTMYRRALGEVTSRYHPEHIPGAGPEQDYLSRLYAPWWTNIHVRYNYQLHHVFFNLEPLLQWRGRSDYADLVKIEPEYAEWVPERLGLRASDICIVHFSGTMKMWDRELYFQQTSDAEFAE